MGAREVRWMFEYLGGEVIKYNATYTNGSRLFACMYVGILVMKARLLIV